MNIYLNKFEEFENLHYKFQYFSIILLFKKKKFKKI